MVNVEWGSISIGAVMLTALGYLYQQNQKLKVKSESEMVTRIEASINNLSQTIETSTEKFERTTEKMWDHIGGMEKRFNNLLGEHRAFTSNGSHSCHIKE